MKTNTFSGFVKLASKMFPLSAGKTRRLAKCSGIFEKKACKIPNGFSVTAEAYRYFVRQNEIDDDIRKILKGLDTGNMRNLAERGYRVRQTILAAEFPIDLRNAIVEAYAKLSGEYSRHKSFQINWDKKDHTNHLREGWMLR